MNEGTGLVFVEEDKKTEQMIEKTNPRKMLSLWKVFVLVTTFIQSTEILFV